MCWIHQDKKKPPQTTNNHKRLDTIANHQTSTNIKLIYVNMHLQSFICMHQPTFINIRTQSCICMYQLTVRRQPSCPMEIGNNPHVILTCYAFLIHITPQTHFHNYKTPPTHAHFHNYKTTTITSIYITNVIHNTKCTHPFPTLLTAELTEFHSTMVHIQEHTIV